MLEDYVAPGAGVGAEIRAIKEAIYKVNGELTALSEIHLDKALWKNNADDFTDLTDTKSLRPKNWPWNLHRKEAVSVTQDAKILVPEYRHVRTAADHRRETGGGGRDGPGEGILTGYTIEEYAHRIYSFEVVTRVSSVAGRSTTIEIARIDLARARLSDWKYHHRKKVGTRTRGPIVWEEGNDSLKYSSREGEALVAPRLEIAEFNSKQASVASALERRNALALVLAFYLQILEGGRSTLNSYRLRRSQ
jgi:hypothetical protein